MPITFTEEDFQTAPAQPKAGFFTEQDFAPKIKKTPQQVMQAVAAAQASRDAVNPPETQGWLGQVAGSDPITGITVGISRLRPDILLRDLLVGLSDPQRFIGGNGGLAAPHQLDQSIIPLGAAEKAVEFFTPGGVLPEGSLGRGAQQFVAETVSGMSAPIPAFTVLAGGGLAKAGMPQQAAQQMAVQFVPPMLSDVGPATEAVVSAEDDQARMSNLLRLGSDLLFPLGMLNTAQGGALLKRQPRVPAPLVPDEVLPPKQQPVAPVSRQLYAPEQPYIDAEVVVPPRLPAPGERPTMPVGSPLDRPAGAARFGVDPTGKAVDISQLSPKEQVELYRGPKEFVPREQYVRPAQQAPVFIGEQALPKREVVFQNETRPVQPVYVPGRAPVEPSGGEVSFRAQAGAEAIPNVRQRALPPVEIPKQEVAFQNETAPEALAKPTVAKLSTSANKNPLGDPMGSTYYATPEDWGAWQKVQTEFKDLIAKGAEFDGPEMMKVRQENENIKNRYGGMPPVEPKVEAPKGMRIKSALKGGQARRSETGALFPTGSEGRPLQTFDKNKKHDVTFMGKSGMANWPHGMWLSPDGKILDASPGHYESGADYLGEKKFDWKRESNNFEDSLDYVFETMRNKGFVQLRGTPDGIEVMSGRISRTQKAALERWGIENEKKVIDNTELANYPSVIYEPPTDAGTPPKSGSIGSGVKGAVDKNKEAGSVENPFARIVEKVKNKEKEKRGETFALSGPRIALDPEESGFKDVTKKVDAQQLWNRVKNKLTPAERDIYEKGGVDKKIVGMGKVSPEEAAEILLESGPEVRTHSYGMEGKVSEAKREYDRMTHEWYDNQPQDVKQAVRRAEMGAEWTTKPEQIEAKYGKETRRLAEQYAKLGDTVRKEPRDTSPRATSAYDTVSALPAHEPMPEWTTSKSRKNVQRVDVVIPNKLRSQRTTEEVEKAWMSTGGHEHEADYWMQDNLHENLPNTLGWSMIQYKDGPNGEKVAVVVEAQSRWGQTLREQQKQISERAQAGMKTAGERDISHPLLRDYNRLILKAAIDQARKEGATHIMVSDAETAMMTEGHDAHTATPPQRYEGANTKNGRKVVDTLNSGGQLYSLGGERKRSRPVLIKGDNILELTWPEVKKLENSGVIEYWPERSTYYDTEWKLTEEYQAPTPRIEQEPGMRLNYDTILPKIMEELSGGKGERVSLGEHKNAMYHGVNAARHGTPRENLIFRNPDGSPKTDVSGTLYKIPQTDKKFSLFEKDRPESVAGRLYVNPIGPIVKQTAKDVATLGKKVKEVGTDFIRAYSEPLQEQMGRLGGPVGKMVSEEAGQIISRGKELYGELTPVIDPAKKQVGKMMREGTTWMRGRNEVTPYASFNNFFGVNEGVVQTPLNAKRGMKLAADANLAIGKMAERANPGFKASGKLQRIPTTVGYDFIVNGGEGRNRWIEGVAKLNNKPITEVENFFNNMKETLGDPSSDAASLDRINQDFTRKFPRTITHIKTATGWHEVVVSDPFNYLEQAAQRTAHSVAFREVYPLIEHNGQWVQSGKLQATRKAIMKELDKGSDIVKFDNLVKALQGHPLDTFKGGATTAIGAVSGTIGSPLKALMLSANAPVNIGEVLSGGPSIFMGYTTMGKAVAKMLTDNTFYDQLELTGARNKAMYNMALDPSSPMRSVARQVATGVRALTGQQFLNEIQETTAAASAKVYSDAIKGGQMSKYSLNRAKALFRAMGFNEGQASKMVKGDVELLKQFENRAAAWLTTGNQSTAEMSRLGASRLFNAAFWFHKYPQMTLNQFRSVGGNWVDDVHAYAKKPTKENWSPLYHNTVLMGRLLGGRSLQGAITLGILAGVSGGIYGIYQTMREAEEESLKFAGDSLVSGFGGPLSVMQRLNQNVKGGESFTKELVKLSAPASINQDLIDMGMGVGRYSGMSKMESISTFLKSKTPISRTIRMGLAVSGLSEKDLELEVAMKAFYKWRKEQPGFVPMGQMGGTDEQVEIRSGMQKVKKAIEAGEDWVAELKKVKDTKGAGASLRAGTMLQVNGKPLDAEQMKSLEKRLGANGLEKIKLRDAMIREVGRELNEKTGSGEKQAPEEIKKPTGKWAVDYETDSVRSQRVMGRLDGAVQEFLKKNGVEDVGYTPALKRGPKKQQLTVEQAKVLEDELVVQLNKMVGTLAKNKNLESQTPKLRQTLISNMLEGARKIAMAKSLGKIPQDPEQQRK